MAGTRKPEGKGINLVLASTIPTTAPYSLEDISLSRTYNIVRFFVLVPHLSTIAQKILQALRRVERTRGRNYRFLKPNLDRTLHQISEAKRFGERNFPYPPHLKAG